MPRNPYPGNKINNHCDVEKYFETKINFNTIYNHPKLNMLEKPVEQGSLDEEKVQLMINEYIVSPSFLRFKNRIVIGDLDNTWYILDGQHRIEMAKQLFSAKNIEDELIFCWFKCKTEDEMRLLFNSINQDSTKNQFYIQQSNFDQLKINDFIQSLKSIGYKDSFSKKKSMNSRIKTIEEFRDDLIKIDFFNGSCNTQQLIDKLKQLNDDFFNIVRFGIDLQENPDNFYMDEQKHIKDKIIFTLKPTNFMEWICDKTKVPVHKNKKGKKRISKKLKDKCWIKEFGNEKFEACCPITTCSKIIIKNYTDLWHAGHIISEYNGGETNIFNLRPICKECNYEMSSTNWDDYDN